MNHMENSFINDCMSNDKKSQEKIFRILSPKMMGMCMRYACNRNEAEEYLQNGMIKVFTRINEYDSSVIFEDWVKEIIVNTIVKTFKKRCVFRVVESVQFLSEPEILDVYKTIPLEHLLEFIQELSPEHRLVFNLHVFEKISHTSIAKILDIDEETTKLIELKSKHELALKCEKWISKKQLK